LRKKSAQRLSAPEERPGTASSKKSVGSSVKKIKVTKTEAPQALVPAATEDPGEKPISATENFFTKESGEQDSSYLKI
jgi:hypothetical protein